MHIMNFESLSDAAILKELGQRLRAARLNRNWTQSALAKQAGIGRRTLQKAEEGEVTTLATLTAILRGLSLLEQLDQLLPPPPQSPVQLALLQGRKRRRASKKRPSNTRSNNWQWGQ